MRILVLSDSHASLGFMRRCVEILKPDAVVHLGDYYDDGQTLGECYPHIRLHQVSGNCDKFRCPPDALEMMCYPVCGVKLFMTHGHRQRVKSGIELLCAEARQYGAQAALYGHTHIPDCHREEDGLWVLNPGSCGSWGGSVGLMETENGNIVSCRILRQSDLEDFV